MLGHKEDVQAIAVTIDQQRIISASKDMTIKVWDIDSGMEVLTLKGHSRLVNGLAITPDGRTLLSVSVTKASKSGI